MFKNGEKYEGFFNEDEISGIGIYIWKNNHIFEGFFEHGKMNGKGLYKSPNGSEYTGDYINNVKEGRGIFKWPNGRIYIGEFSDNKPHGKGTLFEKKVIYEVEFDRGNLTKTIKKNIQTESNNNKSIIYDSHPSIIKKHNYNEYS